MNVTKERGAYQDRETIEHVAGASLETASPGSLDASGHCRGVRPPRRCASDAGDVEGYGRFVHAGSKPVGGPPRFELGEIVRIVAVTGDEGDGLDGLVDPHDLIGREVSVQGATPTVAQDGWIIHVWVEPMRDIVDLPESALQHVGEIEVVGDAGEVRRVVHTAASGRPWRDDVLLTLATATGNPVAARATSQRAVEVLRRIDGVDTVDWRVRELPNEPAGVTLWVYGTGDVLQVFGRILDLADRGAEPDEGNGWYPGSWFDGAWEHDDEGSLINSRWTRTEGTEFLAPAVCRAEVSYRRWTSPRRRSRAEIGRQLPYGPQH